MSHFELTDETVTTPSGVVLHRIRATHDLPKHGVKAGDLGGWVQSTRNLSERAWVSDDARVYGDARVFGDARATSDAQVYGRARVYGNAHLSDRAWVYGDAWVFGNAQVFGNARVSGNALVYGNARVLGDARVCAPQDILVIGPIGPENQWITLARTDTGHHLNIGCWDGTLDELATAWPAAHRDRWRDEYAAAEQLLRHRADSWRNSEGGDQ